VVILAKNEVEGISEVIEGVRPFADEVIVIDGNSTDGTYEKALTHGIAAVKDSGKGKGAAISGSLAHANGDIIVFIDADGSHEPSDIPRLIKPVVEGEADLVVGSRITGGSDEFYMRFGHFLRVLGGCLVTMAINYRFGVDLTDTGNGFRAITRSAALSLHLTARGFDIEQEMVIKALKQKLRVIEVPSHEYARKWGEAKLRLYHGWRHIVNLLVNIF